MKAIVLLSGGLDSTLAAKIAKDLGIELIAFNTISPFCLCNHRSSTGCFHGASAAARELGIRFVSRDVADDFLKIVAAPAHGYGSHMNPCIDCRLLLFRKAKELMAAEGASFIITGEVVGQRPMSQRKPTLDLIEREAGLQGMVVRPLSAGALPETVPEKNGWISRGKLLSISGRSRRSQFALAKEFGINDYPCPSGGCLLTDPSFSKRVKDLIDHASLDIDNVRLLRAGRHFRLGPVSKLVVGRDESENERLLAFADKADLVFVPDDRFPGPLALAIGRFDEQQVETALAIVARYCDGKEGEERRIRVKAKEAQAETIPAIPMDGPLLESYRI